MPPHPGSTWLASMTGPSPPCCPPTPRRRPATVPPLGGCWPPGLAATQGFPAPPPPVTLPHLRPLKDYPLNKPEDHTQKMTRTKLTGSSHSGKPPDFPRMVFSQYPPTAPVCAKLCLGEGTFRKTPSYAHDLCDQHIFGPMFVAFTSPPLFVSGRAESTAAAWRETEPFFFLLRLCPRR